MNETERNAELLRLNEERRQDVRLLHAGQLTEADFVARTKANQAAVRRLLQTDITAPEASNGKAEYY